MTANAARLTPAEVAALLGTCRADLSREATTQADLDIFLKAHLPPQVTVEREVRLSPGDRIDFLIDGRIGIEVKLNAQRPNDVIAQLGRYARHERIEALILLSNRAVDLVPMIGGKPTFNVSLGRAWI